MLLGRLESDLFPNRFRQGLKHPFMPQQDRLDLIQAAFDSPPVLQESFVHCVDAFVRPLLTRQERGLLLNQERDRLFQRVAA